MKNITVNCDGVKISNKEKICLIAGPCQLENEQNALDMAGKISDTGNSNILITERGASFGYNTLVSDMRSIPIMAQTGYPIVFDATHSVQQPGGMGDKSGGERKFVSHLSRAAVAVGIAAVFIETHQDPDNAPSDGPNMVPLNEMDSLVNKLLEIDKLIKN